jgi:hypothetical protein
VAANWQRAVSSPAIDAARFSPESRAMVGRTSRVVVWIVILVCALLACKRKESQAGSGSGSLGDRAAKLQPEAKKRLEQLAALAPKVKAEAAVTSDRPVAVKPARKAVAITGEQWLTDPHRSASSEELNFGNTLLSLCKHKAESAPEKEDDVKYLEECVALKIVAVIRQRSMERPKIKMKSQTYDSGKLKLDVLVYELETAKLIGAYDVLVTNDPELTLPGAEQSEEDWFRMAESDLKVNAETEIEELLGINL